MGAICSAVSPFKLRKMSLSHWQRLRRPSKEWAGKGDDLLIVVVGPCGSGKSTLINDLLGQDIVEVNHGLASRRSQVRCASRAMSETPLESGRPSESTQRVVFLDTPGFDGVDTFSFEVLSNIRSWVQMRYPDKPQFTGIIFLTDISNGNVKPISDRDISLLKEICGTDNLSQMVFGITYWERMTPKQLDWRQQELQNEGLKEVKKLGASVALVNKPSLSNSTAEANRNLHESDSWSLIDTILRSSYGSK